MSKFFNILFQFLIIFCLGAPVKAENDTLTTNSTDEVDEGNRDLNVKRINMQLFVCSYL